MSLDHNHLSHTTWECKYRVVFTPKYRKKVYSGRSGATWTLYSTSLPTKLVEFSGSQIQGEQMQLKLASS